MAGLRYGIAVALVAALAVGGCGGTKVLREAKPLELSESLGTASSSGIAASIEAVIVPNGPGSWARDASWDEYRLRVRTPVSDGVALKRVHLVDALGQPVEAQKDRGELIDASREIEKRYIASGRLVRDSASGAWLIAGGVAAATTGAAIGVAATAASLYGTAMGGAAAAGAGAAAAVGSVLAGGGLVLIGAGVVRVVNNIEVSAELRNRSTTLPLRLTGADLPVTVFFPITPLPSRVELTYEELGIERSLGFDTRETLAQLHAPKPIKIVRRTEPAFPEEAIQMGIKSGYVRARLFLDEDGAVAHVRLLETSSRALVREAIWTMQSWKYNEGWPGRTVEETIRFDRP